MKHTLQLNSSVSSEGYWLQIVFVLPFMFIKKHSNLESKYYNWHWYVFLKRDSDLSNIVEYTQDDNH